MNVDMERMSLNVHFKACGELSYNEYLKNLIDEGKVSLRGLKKDARIYDEIIFDVNIYYFEQNGGYEYAKQFYEEAFHFAEKEYGKDNIISAVMHADEINMWLSDALDKPVYHYHMHLIALPVVEKQVLWTKRCKDKALVGTVKEVVHQVSHSKKWKSELMRDETGKPVCDEKGKPIYVTSYSLLQDRFFEHMKEAGFTGFQRGVRGSTAENLSCLDYKLGQDKKHLTEIGEKIAQAEKRFEEIEPVAMQMYEVEKVGKKSLTGKIQMSQEEYGKLTELAKEGISSRTEIFRLKERIKSLNDKVWALTAKLGQLGNDFIELQEKCKLYLEAIKKFPDKVKTFLNDLIKPKETDRLQKAPQKKQNKNLTDAQR